jgi:ornithine carbamoyltransferase
LLSLLFTYLEHWRKKVSLSSHPYLKSDSGSLFPELAGFSPRHLLASSDLTPKEVRRILRLAKHLKYERSLSGTSVTPKPSRVLALIFEKPSLRTRFTFETAIYELGGMAIYLTKSDIDMGQRESVEDVAKNLSRWASAIVARLYKHETLCELAQHATVPVVNALTDREHPCQALADLLTIEEHLGQGPHRLVYIGDGNNVANSFATTGAMLGHTVVLCTPPGYEADPSCYAFPNVLRSHNPWEAVQDADAVYTDVWVSMGQEAEAEKRLKDFEGFQVNQELMQRAKAGAIFLHCLPARRGLEVSSEVIDGPRSVVFDQAENRLHTQKALLKLLLEGGLG